MNRIPEIIRNFFKHNLLLKVASVLIAFGIWLIVVNVSNPEVRVTVNTNIDISNSDTMTGLDKTYSIDNMGARISYSVRTNQRNEVSAADFDVYVDLRDYSITGALPVYVTPSDRIRDMVSDVSVTPVVVHATTEDMLDKSFDITAAVKGRPEEGYAAAPITFTPNRITLHGPNSEIGKISRIGFDVDVTDASSNIWGSADFIFYDANDNVIKPDSRIQVRNLVTYHVPIYKRKTVSISVQTMGEPAPGYELNSVICEPNFVEIYASDAMLEDISAIILPSVLLNITGATGDVTATVDIASYLPANVYSDAVGNIALAARITKRGMGLPLQEPGAGGPAAAGTAPSGTGTAPAGSPVVQPLAEPSQEHTGSAGETAGQEAPAATEAGQEQESSGAEGTAQPHHGEGAAQEGSEAEAGQAAAGHEESTVAAHEGSTAAAHESSTAAAHESSASNHESSAAAHEGGGEQGGGASSHPSGGSEGAGSQSPGNSLEEVNSNVVVSHSSGS